MTKRKKIYKLLQEELSAQKHWKNKPRGNPRKGGLASREKQRQNNDRDISF